MAPYGKKEKQWQFVGNEVKDVDDLTMDHIRAVYGLGPCNATGKQQGASSADQVTRDSTGSVYPYCGNRYKDAPSETLPPIKGNTSTSCTASRCKDGNPHCLNYMGQEQWEKEDAFDKYYAIFGKMTDLETSKRQPNCPAGMKNLGATCYANSLLQVWFHDLPFRDAIYRSRFKIGADKALDALYQLQHLFAQLDYGIKDIYNPLSLVESLKLDTNVQQDAQEFCNLFMARIDSQLQSQEDEHLRTFIKNQFQGHYSYITTCKNCKKSSVRDCTFYELMLNIKDHCTLMDCFEEFVEAEELVGSDRYSCSHCGSLQDATREIKLDRLPKVLNIQLMRFVYDNTTWTKKKSKDMIRFPETIDFAELLGSKTAVLYDLSAVLVHSGPSAHSGHFMAHVLDKASDKWFMLNDEEVTEFSSTQFDPEDYHEAASKSKAKKTTMKAGAPDAERLLSTLSSRNAYMLTYTRRNSEPATKPTTPPSETLDLVTQDNATLDDELKEYAELKEKVKNEFEQSRDERRKLYRCWDVNSDEDDGCYVSSAALSKYMQLDGGRTTSDEAQPEVPAIVDLSSSSLTCEHQKLCPSLIAKSKRISMTARQLLTEQGVKIDPVLTPMDICTPCTRNLFQDKLYSLMHRQDVDEFEKKSKLKKSPPAAWISKPWLAAWQKVNPPFHRAHTSTTADPGPLAEQYMFDVLCPHSGLGADKSRRKVINKACLDMVTRIYGPMELPGHGDSECQECLELRQPHVNNTKEMAARASSEKQELSGMIMRGSRVDMLPDHRYYAVSEDFFQKWMSFVKRPTVNERPGMIDNSDLLCKHDLFLFDLGNPVDEENDDDVSVIKEDEWSYLKAMYGGGPEIIITMQESMDTDDDSAQAATRLTVQSTPAHCPECRNERILDFSSTTFIIRVYAPGESAVEEQTKASPTNSEVALSPTNSVSAKVCPSSTDSKSTTSKRKQAPANVETGSRRSKRTKAAKSPFKEIRIPVSKRDTIMDLKMKIMQKTDVVPLYQKLQHEQVELDKNDKTIADLELPPNAVLNLFTFDQGMDDLELNNFHDDAPAPGDVGGFSGTGLTEDWF
ncbi:hypothetical protein BGX29_011475 [Mortierella sp. GBA35]|nr:hypothetical protein BGX29_011475 [Mortierella sp. GBA35]